jgi:hypothetical protein
MAKYVRPFLSIVASSRRHLHHFLLALLWPASNLLMGEMEVDELIVTCSSRIRLVGSDICAWKALLPGRDYTRVRSWGLQEKWVRRGRKRIGGLPVLGRNKAAAS